MSSEGPACTRLSCEGSRSASTYPQCSSAQQRNAGESRAPDDYGQGTQANWHPWFQFQGGYGPSSGKFHHRDDRGPCENRRTSLNTWTETSTSEPIRSK